MLGVEAVGLIVFSSTIMFFIFRKKKEQTVFAPNDFRGKKATCDDCFTQKVRVLKKARKVFFR